MAQVIAKLEGPAVSQYCALRLLQVISAVVTFLTHFFSISFLLFLRQVPFYICRRHLMSPYTILLESWYAFDLLFVCFKWEI